MQPLDEREYLKGSAVTFYDKLLATILNFRKSTCGETNWTKNKTREGSSPVWQKFIGQIVNHLARPGRPLPMNHNAAKDTNVWKDTRNISITNLLQTLSMVTHRKKMLIPQTIFKSPQQPHVGEQRITHAKKTSCNEACKTRLDSWRNDSWTIITKFMTTALGRLVHDKFWLDGIGTEIIRHVSIDKCVGQTLHNWH